MKHEEQMADETNQYEYRLLEEIYFWQSMISECRKSDRNAELPRMQEAMALAEFRLLQFNEANEKATRH